MFAQHDWGFGFRRALGAVNPSHFDYFVSRTNTPSGTARWEYKGRSNDGVESGWLSENEMLKSFTPLQLDGFIALRHLYNPHPARDSVPVSVKPRTPLSCRQALTLFPIGFTIWKDFGGGLRLQGQVYDYRDCYWRVRYSDQNWEELIRRELKQLQR